MNVWFDPEQGPPNSDWVWTKYELGAMNWILAEARVVSVPSDESFDHIAIAAKDASKVKCQRH